MMIDDERPFRVGAKTDPRSLKIKRPQVGSYILGFMNVARIMYRDPVYKVTVCVDDLVGR